MNSVTRDVTLWGPAGAAVTILDAATNGSVLTVNSGVDLTVDGLTLRNGQGIGSAPTAGGAIRALSPAAVTVRDAVLEASSADQGGALYVGAGVLTLEGSSVAGSGRFGGGVLIRDATLICDEETRIAGSASSTGGGLYADGATVTGCHVCLLYTSDAADE